MMTPNPQALPELAGIDLADSYLFGLAAEGRDLRLTMLFALTGDHPAHEPPLPGEQHCYRGGTPSSPRCASAWSLPATPARGETALAFQPFSASAISARLCASP